ncbi:hypothetical protein P171DRAFT_438566 [Karstenula rhodostoma CBS 690.94]|uniref:BRCT domain-containing protein n=1 Tax=Karstenula rhodostoma CBS 690.94 TaxID=1392251 RepID=A0A9P4UJP4_9PLEO|nr:hypothetical protein P171DRAFT_438566 [Karstenula rhodostoma CBS 690.94]
MAILKGLVIASVGDIKDHSGKSISNEQLKKWVVNNKGRWASEVGKGTTHLISSKDAYKKDAKAVQKAKGLRIFVVSYDWLEDSLHKGRKVAERKYTWGEVRAQRKKQKLMTRLGPPADSQKFNAGCELAKQDIGSGTSRKRPSGFFSSALDDLRKKREAREAEEKAKKAQAANTLSSHEPGALVAKEISEPHTPPTTARFASESTVAAPGSPVRQHSQLAVCNARLSHAHVEEEVTSSEKVVDTSTTDNTPKPSLFPPSLKYTPPSSSSGPHLPGPSTTPTPAPATATAVQPVETKPANPKLEDLYHIYLDAKGFEYKLILLRSNPYLNNFARYDLRMYESHTVPHVYCTVARYVPPAGAKPAAASTSVVPQSAQLPAQTATASPPSAQAGQTIHPAAAHLHALITPPLPSPSTPYRTAIAPPNSDFPTAFRAFRHAFRDLTLLSWHERLDPALQRLRAQAFCIEPFVWRRPAEGLPMGFVPPTWAPLGEHADVQLEGYTRNAWGLPALDEPLGTEGAIGSALFREAEEARRREEEKRRADERRAVQERMRAKRGGVGKAAGRQGQTKMGPQYYEPHQKQGVVANRAMLFGGGAENGGGSRASTPGTGRAVIVDYRSARQKRFDSRGFDY